MQCGTSLAREQDLTSDSLNWAVKSFHCAGEVTIFRDGPLGKGLRHLPFVSFLDMISGGFLTFFGVSRFVL